MSGVIAGLAISTVSAGASFAQAAKQNRLKRQAQENAEQAMADAKKQLDKNFAEQQAIKKEAYDLERQAMLVQGAQLTQAGIESERGSAATAGRVFAQQQLGQQQIRSAMADEMTNIEAAVLEEESRLRDLGVGLDLEEVAGQQMMAADAQRAAAASTQQGFQSALGAAKLAVEQVPLYREDKVAKQLALEEQQLAAIRQRPKVQALKGVELSNDTLTEKAIQQGLQRINAEAIDPFSYAPSMYPTTLNLPKIK
jgi:hypothetical protein